MKNANPIVIANPKLLDSLFGGVNLVLSDALPWLNTYETAVKMSNEKGLYPAVETNAKGSLDYLNLLPDSNLGNYSYWDVSDGIEANLKGDFVWLHFKAALVVWGDLQKVYPADWKEKTVQNAASDVLEVIKIGDFAPVRMMLKELHFEHMNIYKGYYLKEIKTQHLMRPFFGFRIGFEIVANIKNC